MFKAGSRVLVNPHSLEWVESKRKGVKLVQRWIGPFEILQRINPNTYRLRMPDNYPGFPVFNISHLKPYVESEQNLGERNSFEDIDIRKKAREEYDVERIVGHRRRRGTLEFRVRWEGYGPLHDTWQTARDLRNAPRLLGEYKRLHDL